MQLEQNCLLRCWSANAQGQKKMDFTFDYMLHYVTECGRGICCVGYFVAVICAMLCRDAAHDFGFSNEDVKRIYLAILCHVTLWLFNIAMGNGPFIDGLPINSMVIFHGYVSHNQMVSTGKAEQSSRCWQERSLCPPQKVPSNWRTTKHRPLRFHLPRRRPLSWYQWSTYNEQVNVLSDGELHRQNVSCLPARFQLVLSPPCLKTLQASSAGMQRSIPHGYQ